MTPVHPPCPRAPGEEERLLREILALQREMAEELKAIRAELSGRRAQASTTPPIPADGTGEAVAPLVQALADRNRSAMRAAQTLTTPNRRKP